MKKPRKKQGGTAAPKPKRQAPARRRKRLTWQNVTLIAGAVGAVIGVATQIPAVKTMFVTMLFDADVELKITECKPKLIIATFTNRGGKPGRVGPPSFLKMVDGKFTKLELDGVLDEPILPEGVDIPADGGEKHFSYNNEGLFFSAAEAGIRRTGTKGPLSSKCEIGASADLMSGADKKWTMEAKPPCECKWAD